MDWLARNVEWLFSGVAIAVPLAILGFFLNKKAPRQKQVLGEKSKAYQAGRDINIGGGK
ncbi:hypothetical protein [Pseudomonas sp. TWP3-1]|uniref:hypothetical protein n=1 Tax=Pseudomonas sp. TWP3-1 TaxID=2804631 RepID=UPI003CF502F2